MEIHQSWWCTLKTKDQGIPQGLSTLEKPTEGSEQSYLEQISQFVHRKTDREKGSDYEKIELFWPHDLLKVRREQVQ